ncbi:MAG: GGDEF domain-containing protein [Selenomonas sp.]|jgi:diguanylate cyclase (GGDEF)-like protein|nr:GGDEF domain-containing protein [Selenomonas sp.]
MAHLVRFIETTTKELELSNQKLAKLAKIDRLTDLYNRGETEAGLRRMLDQAQQAQKPLAVMMMDVDDFKGVNDHHGHATGDETLRRIAAILRRNTRKGIDIPGRWGGDEFLVVFGDTDMATAQMIAERIPAAWWQNCRFRMGEGVVTTSIGRCSGRP